MSDFELTRIENDVNGNGRYVVHFLACNTQQELATVPWGLGRVSALYAMALARAKKKGGKKYRAKNYGGGIVFQGYRQQIEEIVAKLAKGE